MHEEVNEHDILKALQLYPLCFLFRSRFLLFTRKQYKYFRMSTLILRKCMSKAVTISVCLAETLRTPVVNIYKVSLVNISSVFI